MTAGTREHVPDEHGTKIGQVWLRVDGSGYWAGYHDPTNTRVDDSYTSPEQATAALRAVHAAHVARLAREAAMPAGERFALAAHRQLHIGPNTRRYRNGRHVRDEVIHAIQDAVCYPVDEPDRAALRAGWNVLYVWSKNIDGNRYSARLSLLLSNPTPWNFVGLLADLVDQGVEHDGHSRAYFLHGTRWHRYADTRHMTLPDGPLERPRRA
jgi:hypothetical protein